VFAEKVKVVKQPESRPISVGERLELVCEGSGVPRPEYLWFKADIHGNPYPMTGHKSSRLVLEEVKKEDSGRYCCRVMNKYHQDFTRWIEVVAKEPQGLNGTVLPNIHPEAFPVVVDFPCEKRVNLGDPLVIVCDGRGEQPLQYQWFKNNQILTFGRRQDLVIERVGLEHGGEYMCKVSNRFGDNLSRSCTVIIMSPPTPMMSPPTPMMNPPTPMMNPPTPMMNPPTPVNAIPQQEVVYTSPMDHPSISPNWVVGHPEHPIYYGEDTEPRVPPTNAKSNNLDLYRNDYRHVDAMPRPPPHPSTLFPHPEPVPYEQGPTVKCTDKVALLIGNVKYRVARHNNLSTPETDVQDLAVLLTSLDFKCVSLINLTKEEMDHAIAYFLSLLGEGVYALFFFAGHGFEVDNRQYLMSVDASAHHNPKECVCVQSLKDSMHTSGSKLNVLLLDMCRDKLTTPMPHPAHFDAERRNNPHGNQALPYNTYTVIGYATSEAGLSYEPRPQTGQPQGEQNSFFVRAIKDALQMQKNSNLQNLSDFLGQVQRNVRNLKPKAIGNGPWQLPQVVSNLGEDLSLTDKIEDCLDYAIESERLTRQRMWEKALTIPKELIVSSSNQIAPFRLSFEAEHTNVLIVTVELLKGSRWSVQIHQLSLELRSRSGYDKTVNSPMTPDSLLGMTIEDTVQKYSPKESARKDIMFFRIPDIQKIRPPVFMYLTVTYKYNSHHMTTLDDASEKTETVSVEFRDPPLYASLHGL
jgi:mucosa-associated lymphoid tissue lymphoma translocation protein 1